MGYRVKYRYKGRVFSTRMKHHPGKRIPVRVSVAPVGDAWEHHLASSRSPTRLHAADDYHAGATGQYLNALVLYSTIYGCRSDGLAAINVSGEEAANLQASSDAITQESGVNPAAR